MITSHELYEKTIEDIESKKASRERGEFNGIPFCFENYHHYFESWNKGEYTGILGSTGSGKSRFLRYLLYDMADFAITQKYPLIILYFALEDPNISVSKKIMSHYLFTKHNIKINPVSLNSSHKALDSSVLYHLKNDAPFYKRLYQIIRVINDISSPNQINEYVQKCYEKYGQKAHIVVAIDNQSNITKDEEDASEWAAIKRFSRDIIRLKWCKQGITPLMILQLDFDQERHAFRQSGKGSLLSLEPNLSSIGDAKVISRSCHTVFALFDPHRFGIEEYPFVDNGGYNIKIMRDRFRSLLMLKSNEGAIAPRLPLFFNGAQEVFSQLPNLENKEALKRIYDEIIREELSRKNKSTLF